MASNIIDIRDARKDAAQQTDTAAPSPVTDRRVLVLDDEPDVAQTLATQIASLGHEVFAVTEYSAFCEALDSFRPDILVIDTCMPGHDALDVIRDLDSSSPVQIVVTSGYGRRMIETVIHSARHYGHDVLGGLPKPVRRDALKVLLARSDNAVVAARVQGASNRDVYVPTESELRLAFARDEFSAYFQPKLCLKTNKICGFEALVRWNHPKQGLLPPVAFLPQIHEYDLEADLTFLMLDKSCGFLSDLPDPALRIAVNSTLTTVQLPEFRTRLDETMQRHRIIPGRLIIEITETGDAELPQGAIETLARLRMAGYTLSIDDFGTGMSGLTRLVRVPFAELKIDRSFVLGLNQSEEAQDIVATLVKLGQTLEMFISAEGVEDEDTLHRLETLGCDVAQGYYIGRPMPADAAARLLQSAANG